MYDNLTGRLDTIDFEDVLNGKTMRITQRCCLVNDLQCMLSSFTHCCSLTVISRYLFTRLKLPVQATAYFSCCAWKNSVRHCCRWHVSVNIHVVMLIWSQVQDVEVFRACSLCCVSISRRLDCVAEQTTQNDARLSSSFYLLRMWQHRQNICK
jgi:hypothetical protein